MPNLTILIMLLVSAALSTGPALCIKPPDRQLSINYRQLLDNNQIVRTGQTLSIAAANPQSRRAVQPFLDPYSRLLPLALEMEKGPLSTRHYDLADTYPGDTPEPAWAAILRQKQILVLPDYRQHVLVFLPGKNPGQAYRKYYPVLRHMLNALAPRNKAPLGVTVYAYTNHYQASVLKLNLSPFSVRASTFPREKGKQGLDLTGLKKFFEQNGQLECAELSRKNGLILYAKRPGSMTLNGKPVTLADVAVAYRAVFHAADNPAFVSIDPNKDITKATINFGGLLQDTKIGAVILAADKRFKTLSSGLDPDSFKDLRATTRKKIPGFYSVSEREFLNNSGNSGAWIKTRFWFYPDSITLVSETKNPFLRIKSPRFLADAERSSDEFASMQEYEKLKKQYLLPGIKKNIDHLNGHYNDYARVFPEIQELTGVARLMGLAAWLKKNNPGWLDLDELLTLRLIPVPTEKQRNQLITASQPAPVPDDGITITLLSPLLDQKIRPFFSTTKNLAEFLSKSDSANEELMPQYLEKAKILLNKDIDVRTIITNRKTLETFCRVAAGNLSSNGVKKIALDQEAENLKRLLSHIQALKERLASENSGLSDDLFADYTQQIASYNAKGAAHNEKVQDYNTMLSQTPHKIFIEINGGVNLDPKLFKITQAAPTDLVIIKEIKKQSHPGITPSTGGTTTWVRSRPTPTTGSPVPPVPNLQGKKLLATTLYQRNRNQADGSWAYLLTRAGNPLLNVHYDVGTKQLQLLHFQNNQVDEQLIGSKLTPNTLVFTMPDQN